MTITDSISNRRSGVAAALLLAALSVSMTGCSSAKSGKSSAATAPARTSASQPAPAGAAWRGVANLPESALDAAHRAKAQALLDAGAMYLLRQRQGDGSWSTGRSTAAPPITAMVLKALVQHPGYGVEHPAVKRAYEVLLTFKQSDGGVYVAEEGGSSYTSAVALMALAAAKSPEYASHVKDLTAYLKSLQIVAGAESTDGKAIAADDPNVGGLGYAKGAASGDLSVVGMWMEALHEAGVPADDPAMQQAMAFISRLQNNTETNRMDWASQGSNDGGFVYRFPKDAQGARSYGTMTYTGFKSFLYAGVKRDDPRVRAAFDWIRKYWRLDANPNMPQAQSQAGLYYYYHVFAKALRAWGQDVITDPEGAGHNWRHELIDHLAQRVRKDGSWVNNSDRWWEGHPVLATSFAMLALEEALKAPTQP
ncbi:MAG: prenyltransferase/squalene oxidase repeat-containing protein [Planctomycetaceae bacterium]